MKIEFYDPFENENLKYQKDAIEAITDIFKGQEITHTLFGVKAHDIVGTEQIETGIGNRLTLSEDELLKNIQDIQKRNALEITKRVDKNNLNFSVEMETGTGKTYVFLRTIFELNKNYGFKKFIIVVPSIAIKEGIKKNLDITKEHFKTLYDNTPYNYFIYDSNKLNQINEFARSADLEIMIMNIDAFNKKDINKIHQQQEATLGERPIDLIASTRPIVIIDEPQSVDSTQKAKSAIESLNPLFILRYSATHKEKYNLMYKLDAVDAYEKKLVKQIEVASVKLSDTSNLPYIKFISVDNKKGIKAKIEIEVFQNGRLQRKIKTIKGNSDLFEITGRDVYSGYLVREIYAEIGNEYIEFANGKILRLGEAIGDVDKEHLQYLQIQKTIEEHLEKERIYLKKGIKVLSLFFIDKVANYREYDEEGNPKPGKFDGFFKKAFNELINKPKYQELKKVYDNLNIDEIHDGYFSQDKKGKIKDTKGNTKADESTYEKIMKNKEKLLSLDEPLRFIFSHSALREGWDNPNVFQICTLNETKSVVKKRQEIGRGLRLCVNSKGERVYGFDINRLTVIANESYEDFAKKLQKEYEDDLGIKFGIIEKHIFSPILGEKSEEFFEFLIENEYIDEKGKVREKLKEEIDNLSIPKELEDKKEEIINTIKKTVGRKIEIKNANERKIVKLKKQVLLSDDFINLWNGIKYKTIYNIDFDVETLIRKCIKRIDEEVVISHIKYEYEKAKIDVKRSEISAVDGVNRVEHLANVNFELPDIVSFLQEETKLKRKDIIRILTGTKKLNHFKNNPQRFMEEVLRVIKEEMSELIVEGVKYEKINSEYAIQEIFDKEEIVAYMKNLKEAQKSVTDFVICDSEIEKKFVEEFEKNENVKLFAKLPSNFKVNTPVGSYNPDFAIVVEVEGEEKLYFVLESKGSISKEDRRNKENYKINCAKKHFEILSNEHKDLRYVVEKDFEGFKKYL